MKSTDLMANLQDMDFNARIENLRNSFPSDIDALVVSHLTNVRYLCGYTGSNGTLVITRDSIDFISDGRYSTQSKEEIQSSGIQAEIHITKQGQGNWDYLNELLKNVKVIGLEADTTTWSMLKAFESHFEGKDFFPTTQLVEKLRLIKQPGEVDRIRAACRIADEAFEEVKGYLAELPTEKEFAAVLDRKMVDLGAQGNSFETIVACGTRGALPHARPTDAKIEPNQMIVIDFGCVVDGYCSDMTRTVSVGELSGDQQKMWDQVIESQKLGREFVKSGVTTKEVDTKCREFLDSQGVGKYFAHGTGHGVGLDIHENPRVSQVSETKLEPSMIITVEPGIYIEGLAGVRIEDTLCVTQDGAEVLTTAPKELVITS